MSKKTWASFLMTLAISMCLCGLALGQETTGSIVGTVRDSNGAGLPGVTVTVTDPSKADLVVRTVTTEDDGTFSVPNVQVSTYNIIVESANFKKSITTDVKVDVGQRRLVDLTMEAGNIAETVTVESDQVSVELSTPTAGTTISGDQVRELSINNRNFIQLVTLAPGVSSNLSDQVFVGTTNPDGQANIVAISVNGARSSQNTFTVDGADVTDRGSNLTIQAYPSIDSIGEFKVLRSLYPAESGRSGGGQINVVTRSGTDKFHGSLFEFVRNEKFNANTFFNNRNRPLGTDDDGRAIRPPFRYNNFGFTVGGPVYFLRLGERDPSDSVFSKVPRTFFFFSEEQRRDIRFPSLNSTVPTASLRQGIFPIDICLSATIPGAGPRPCSNILPAGTPFTSRAAINPVTQAYLGIYQQLPLPNSPNPLTPFNLSFPTRNTFKFQQEIIKVDTAFTNDLSAYYRYQRDKIPTVEANSLFSQGSSLPGVSTTQTDSPGRTHTFQMTYVASPNFIVEGRYNRVYGAILSSNIGLLSTAVTSVPVNLAYPNQRDRIPTLTGNGFNGFSGFGPYDNFSTKEDMGGNITYILGGHTVKFGGIFSKYRKNENALAGSNEGSFFGFLNTTSASPTQASVCAPSEQTTSGACRSTTAVNLQAFANFLLGTNASFTQAKADYTADLRQQNVELYAQDEFRLRPNLTLYLGVRYSFFGSPRDENGLLSNFVPELYNPTSAPLVTGAGNRVVGSGNFCNGLIVNEQNYQTAPLGCTPTVSPYGEHVVEAPKTNFGPRVGLAWDPFGTGKTAIRTGYGIYHEQTLVGIFLQNLISNPPYQETTTLSQINLSDSFGTNPISSTGAITVRGQDTDWKTPYMQHWSFDVQHQLTSNTLIDVGYYGSKGTNLIGIVDINLLRPGFASTQTCAVGSSTTPTVACQTSGVPFTSGTQELILDQIRPFRGYRAVNIIKPMFNSTYHSMQVFAQHRFSGDSQASFAYTWSKNLTNSQTDRSTAPQNPFDIDSEYGRAQLDRRHVFTANYVYELPFYREQRGFRGKLLGGWQASGIVTYQTGLPFTAVFGGFDPAGLGFLGPSASGPRPTQFADPFIPGPVAANPDPRCQSTISQGGLAADKVRVFGSWFNPCAFQTSISLSGVEAVPGSAGRGTIDGPRTFRTDFTLTKNIRFTESMRLQLRGEVFNLFNTTNFTTFGTNPTVLGSYGIITGTRDPRTFQFGIKFIF
ncbi:MAG: carboxypeptidase regulatory-like domain-containing protein [Pyrinomonadaceae bacterium]